MTPRSPPTQRLSGANSFTCTDVRSVYLIDKPYSWGWGVHQGTASKRVQQNSLCTAPVVPCGRTQGPGRDTDVGGGEQERACCGESPRPGRAGAAVAKGSLWGVPRPVAVLKPGPGLRQPRWGAGSPARAGSRFTRAWGGRNTHKYPVQSLCRLGADSASLASLLAAPQ